MHNSNCFDSSVDLKLASQIIYISPIQLNIVPTILVLVTFGGHLSIEKIYHISHFSLFIDCDFEHFLIFIILWGLVLFSGEHDIRCLQRKVLLEALLKELPNGTIRYSSKVVSVEESGYLKLVHLADGSILKTKVKSVYHLLSDKQVVCCRLTNYSMDINQIHHNY